LLLVAFIAAAAQDQAKGVLLLGGSAGIGFDDLRYPHGRFLVFRDSYK
jgi:hypothetical protein